MRFDFDVVIIGGGSGGFAAARTAANAGLKTVVIEGGEEVGGLCILRGCMPTKALLYAAEVKHLAEHAETWGVRAGKVSFDFAKAMARKDAVIKDFADYRVQQLNEGKFKFIRANAKFLDAHTLELNDGRKITAKNFVIATGSRVAPTPLPELRDVGYLTSDDAPKLSKLPKSLIVLGGGAIGCEFAQFLSRFGAKITLIQRSPHVLHEFDADVTTEIEKVFRREGVELFTNTKLFYAKRSGDLKTVVFDCHGKMTTASAEEILFALGRVPNTTDIGLEKVGVKTERGRIVCDEFMRTSAPHIFAAGDCVGPHDIVHLAVQQGEVAGENIVADNGSRGRSPHRMDYRLFTVVVFTDPHIAQVGLNEKQAKAQNIPYLAASYPFNDHGKSIIMEAKDGFVKLLCDPKSGEIIGGACIGPAGGELIHEIVVAMSKRMTVQELATIPHYHPTLAEIWTYPAEELAEKISRKQKGL
ncbi:MAG TPA: dihydrolipoyl dehydrogenase [Methylomirabilota bacterium]|nr:dihydrolipoyl dehydrogenase [Methylomirabilota bacterium]